MKRASVYSMPGIPRVELTINQLLEIIRDECVYFFDTSVQAFHYKRTAVDIDGSWSVLNHEGNPDLTYKSGYRWVNKTIPINRRHARLLFLHVAIEHFDLAKTAGLTNFVYPRYNRSNVYHARNIIQGMMDIGYITQEEYQILINRIKYQIKLKTRNTLL